MNTKKRLQNKINLYLTKSTLHGLKYIGKPHATLFEKLFWWISFASGVVFACISIIQIFDKYNHNGIIVSINPKPMSASKVPFPTLTICNMNRVNKQRAEEILKNGTQLEKKLLYDLCHVKMPYLFIKHKEESVEHVIKTVLKLSPTCQEMLEYCRWNDVEYDCSKIFSTVLTDIGACCSFNNLPLSYVFKKSLKISGFKYNSSYPIDIWQLEKGYSINSTNDTIPWRLKGSGLTIVLDAELHNYYCSLTNSAGFIALMTNPNEMIGMKGTSMHFMPGMEAVLAIKPTIIDASPSLRNSKIKSRRCYFVNEYKLNFYKTYTMRNCLVECYAKHVLAECTNHKHVCGMEEDTCVNYVIERIVTNQNPLEDGDICNCLPRCFEYRFSNHISYGRLFENLSINNDIHRNHPLEYFVKNSIILTMKYKDSAINRRTKSEIYGYFELLSSMGGLLSIFLGFSFLSAVEFIFFIGFTIIPIFFNGYMINMF